MMDESQLDSQALAVLKSDGNMSSLAGECLESFSQIALIELLATYHAMSEEADDDAFDAWFDGLSQEARQALKVFEVARARVELSL